MIFDRAFCRNKGFFVVALCLFMLFAPDDYNLYLYKFMLPYFLIGYKADGAIRFYNGLKERSKRIAELTLLLLFIAGLIGWRTDFYVYVTQISLFFNKYDFTWVAFCDIYRWLMGLIGTAVLCVIVLYFNNAVRLSERLITSVRFLSSNTMALYIMNVIICSYVLKPLTMNCKHNIAINLVEAVLMCILECLVIAIIKRNRLLRKALLGNR